MAPAHRPHGEFAALRHRNCRLLWYGNSISFVSGWLDQVALNWLVISTTSDPVMLGLVNLDRGLPTMPIFIAGFSLFLMLFAVAPNMYWAIPFLFAAGMMHIAYNSSNNTILQLTVDDAYCGRVLSSLFMTRGLMPIGTATMALFSSFA